MPPLPPPESPAPATQSADKEITEGEQLEKVELPEGYTHEQLISDFSKVSDTPEKIAANEQERWIMYSRAALLLESGAYPSLSAAERKCAKLRLNRLKLGKVRKMLQHGPLPHECPEDFRIGSNPKLTLSHQEKMDLMQIIRFHAQSSLSLTVPQIERCIVALRMSKAGLFADDPPVDVQEERLELHYKNYDTGALWKNFREWCKASQDSSDWLSVKKMKQKNVADVASLTPDTVVRTLAELQDTLLEMGIAKMVDGEAIIQEDECHRIITTDEKGLHLDSVSKLFSWLWTKHSFEMNSFHQKGFYVCTCLTFRSFPAREPTNRWGA